MKKYEKPVVMINEELAEGVYAASGVSSDCWRIDYITPVRNDNTMNVESFVQVGVHVTHINYANPDNHLSSAKLVIAFNQTIDSCVVDRVSDVRVDPPQGNIVMLYPNAGTTNGNEGIGFNITVECASPSTLEYDENQTYIVCEGL